MDWRHKLWPLVPVATALAVWFGTGLHPVWWVLWLIPFFAFVAGGVAPARWRWLLGMASFFVGELNVWSYLSILPLPIRVAMLLLPAAAFGGCVSCFALFAARGKPWSALLVPAAMWVSYEYIVSQLSPHGTFFVLAYAEAEFLPVAQLASFGGLWLIDAVIFVVASGTALLALGRAHRVRIRMVAVLVGILALVGGWATWRMRNDARLDLTSRVALVASNRPENMQFEAPGASEAILRRYLAHVAEVAAQGAQLIVFPEHMIAFRETGPDANAAEIESLLQNSAEENHAVIVLGVDRLDRAGTWWNEARIYSPNTTVQTYQKRHLLPGAESRYRPGARWLEFSVQSQQVGVAICKDLDFTSTGKAYGGKRIQLLVVPAFDFNVDGWLHSRMALMRGIENGFAIARCAKTGLLTVADSCGRVLGEAASGSSEFAAVNAACPIGTERAVYSRFGDGCAWLAVAGVCFAMLRAFVAKLRARNRPA